MKAADIGLRAKTYLEQKGVVGEPIPADKLTDQDARFPVRTLVNVQGSFFAYGCLFRGGKKMLFNSDSVALGNSGGGEIFGNRFEYELPDSGSAAPNSAICLAGVGGWATANGPVRFENNTVINFASNASAAAVTAAAIDLNVQGSSTAVAARNNIFINFATGVRKMPTTAIEAYNFYQGVGQPVRRRDTDAADTLGTGSLVGTAGLGLNYEMYTSSPAYGTGSFQGYRNDALGGAFRNPPSMGGLEYKPPRTMRA